MAQLTGPVFVFHLDRAAVVAPATCMEIYPATAINRYEPIKFIKKLPKPLFSLSFDPSYACLIIFSGHIAKAKSTQKTQQVYER